MIVNPPAALRSVAAGRDSFAAVMRLLGLPADTSAQGARWPVGCRRIRALSPLFTEGAAAGAMYLVRAGTFKTVRVDADGYEQVLGFAGRGELLGHETLVGLPHGSSAVALEDSDVCVLLGPDLHALRHAVPAFDSALQRAFVHQLQHAGDMAELMNAVAAEVRLARFFVQESARMMAQGQSGRRLRLRMSRRDIASYLGLAHETISRALGVLSRLGCVTVHHREIEITDTQALAACARCTRGRSPQAAEAVRLVA
jgi:CRP/FNR family transcriptional regulator, anaerobic regulatory protein